VQARSGSGGGIYVSGGTVTSQLKMAHNSAGIGGGVYVVTIRELTCMLQACTVHLSHVTA
jgi:hypothetical protein